MSATEIISEGPEGIILESVLEGYAEYYSADLSEKVIRGMTENALKGKFSGGAIPFGYIINADRRFEIDPLTAPFVAETFQRYNDGQTMREIRDWLNEKGIKNKRGGPMTFNVIQHMLSNRRYIGELKYRDVLIPDAIPPIVSVELFNDVQEKMLKNKKAPARRKAEDDYLLTTKLFCGHCGALMFGESGTSRTGEVHRYYKCATAKKHKGCKKKTVRKQWLEDLVVNQTMQLVKDDTAMESIIAKVMELQNKENTNIPLYVKQLRDAESGIQNMLNAIQAGILTSSTKERLEQLEEAKRELEVRIAEEKLAKPKVTEEFIRFWLLRFRKLDMSLKDQRQALVDTFINSIYLYDDKVLITFNYKEGTQTITFAEATEVASEGNGSDLDCIPAFVNDSFQKGCRFSFLREPLRNAAGQSFLRSDSLLYLSYPCRGNAAGTQGRNRNIMQIHDLFGRQTAFETVRMPDGTEAALPAEHAAVLYVNEQPAFRVVCTPERLPQLALGRLLTEGWITSAEEVEQITVCAEGLKVSVYLNHPLTARRAAAQEVSSCCTDNVTLGNPVEPLPLQTVPQLELQPEWIELLTAAMDAGLPLYRATRAVHSCFVLREGRLLFACEDIGRHNALDKAVGQMLLQGIPLTECVLYTSGRVPVDMVRKAIRAGVPALVSKTMPTVQSLELAQEYGLQLVCGRKHPLTLSKMEK